MIVREATLLTLVRAKRELDPLLHLLPTMPLEGRRMLGTAGRAAAGWGLRASRAPRWSAAARRRRLKAMVKVLTLGVNGTGSAVVSASRSVEGYDTRRLQDAFISAASSQGETDEPWLSGRSPARDRWRRGTNVRAPPYGYRIAARCRQASCKAPAPLGAIGSSTSRRRMVGSSNPKC
jgi:hypothetical protein